jgi:hypothetical protein
MTHYFKVKTSNNLTIALKIGRAIAILRPPQMTDHRLKFQTLRLTVADANGQLEHVDARQLSVYPAGLSSRGSYVSLLRQPDLDALLCAVPQGLIADRGTKNHARPLAAYLVGRGGLLAIRAQYCDASQARRGLRGFPLDDALGLIEGYSPGLARLMCRIAAEQSYELAAADLLAYAGVSVEGRAIQRMADLMGPKMRDLRESQPEPATPKPVPVMYASADGTGVPMMRNALEGHSAAFGRNQSRRGI